MTNNDLVLKQKQTKINTPLSKIKQLQFCVKKICIMTELADEQIIICSQANFSLICNIYVWVDKKKIVKSGPSLDNYVEMNVHDRLNEYASIPD